MCAPHKKNHDAMPKQGHFSLVPIYEELGAFAGIFLALPIFPIMLILRRFVFHPQNQNNDDCNQHQSDHHTDQNAKDRRKF